MPLRSLLFAFTSGCLLVLSIASARTQTKPYPAEVVKNYIQSCTSGRGPEVEAVCACTIKKIQANYTLEEYKNINSLIQKTGRIPPSLITILSICQDNPNS